MTDRPHIEQLANDLIEKYPPDNRLGLEVGDWTCHINSNSPALIEHLRRYFHPYPARVENPVTRIVAIQAPEPDFAIEFTDWPREGGKTGRKEEFADIPGGRVIRKVRTGMQFLLGDKIRLGVGDCEKNDNQVINFTLTQNINWLLENGYVICHAAAIEHKGKGLMFAGFSGGGKSTLALHLMSRGARFISNDRVQMMDNGGTVKMVGIPKLPRINPGTALNNEDLSHILTPERKAELEQLPKDELWKLEEKYDVYIDKCFGPDRFKPGAKVDALFVLNWHRNSDGTTEVHEVQLTKRDDLLKAVMKSPGPFWIPKDGRPPARKPDVDPERYRPHIQNLRTFEVTGKVDFETACDRIEAILKDL